MIGVIADDLTGAAEIGAVGLRHGLRAEIVRHGKPSGRAEVVCVDTDSRSCSPDEAATRAAAAAKLLRAAGAQWIYKKVDSVLRGQVTAEVEAVMTTASVEPRPAAAGQSLAGPRDPRWPIFCARQADSQDGVCARSGVSAARVAGAAVAEAAGEIFAAPVQRRPHPVGRHHRRRRGGHVGGCAGLGCASRSGNAAGGRVGIFQRAAGCGTRSGAGRGGCRTGTGRRGANCSSAARSPNRPANLWARRGGARRRCFRCRRN